MSWTVAARPHRWWVLASIAVLTVAVVVVAPRLGAGTSGGPSAQAELPPGPVVLVPGYGGGTNSLDALATALRRSGHETTVLHLLGDGTGDLVAQARLLQSTVDALLAKGARSVDVVGYSAGGIVTRIWADQLAGAVHARRIVLLGTPNHGTEVAGLASGFGAGLCPVACEQLVPGSQLLTSLGDTGTARGPQWVSIWTDQDDVVTPPDSARLDGASNLTVQSVCPGEQVDHGSLPRDDVVEGLVARALGAAPFVTPPASECAAVRISW